MENDDFDRKSLIERLEKFAEIHGVSQDEVVSVRLRALQQDGSVAYVAWPSHETAIERAGVARVPKSVPFFGAEYLPGGFRAYQTDQGEILWIPHETGLEWIGLILGIIGAIEPTYHGIKWLVNRWKGKPDRDIYQSNIVHSIQVELRMVRNGDLLQRVIIQQVETIIDTDGAFIQVLEREIQQMRRSV